MSSSSSLKSSGQILVLDMGTTHAKAFIIDASGAIVASAIHSLNHYTPMPGWVEQDPFEFLDAARYVLKEAYRQRTGDVMAMGITNQRESVVGWSPIDGQPLYPIISWQDQRTHEQCHNIARTEASRTLVRERTGLLIDPYFSASKMHWLTNYVDTLGSHIGTLDSWLLYNLATDNPYLTDRTNAARTLLFNIRTLVWDAELLDLFGLHEELLPEVRPSFSHFGFLDAAVIGRKLPILAIMGDQQASLYAAGNIPGTIKVTYGTSMFAMKILETFTLQDGILTTLVVGKDDSPLYAFEDAIGPAALRVSAVLDEPDKLSKVLRALAVEVAASLEIMLGPNDKEIVIDGGISQSPDFVFIQEALLEHVRVVRQSSPEGMALGVAKLIRDRIIR